jgi:dihydroorotate dehydrogenase (NAD+) catalytic subunit
MKLRNIEFGHVLGASGVQGFFGEGYWFHKPWKHLGLDFSKMTFVAKTATPFPQKGNMELTSDFKPKKLMPSCVKVKMVDGLMLNAVGLSNPGLETFLKTGKWQQRVEPFFISITSLADSAQKRIDEIKKMTDLIGQHKNDFRAPFGIQINLSCPNTGHDPKELIGESAKVLDVVAALNVPLMPKYSIAAAPIEAIMELQEHSNCDAICVSNTISFGSAQVDWEKTWGNKISPLAHIGGGGISGKVLRPLVCEWIKNIRNAGFTKPINGGGGILKKSDVDEFHKAGASSIFLGSVATLRPWRVGGIINHANQLSW